MAEEVVAESPCSVSGSLPVSITAVFHPPSGVAVVTASMPEPSGAGGVQVVICTGKEISSTTRATRAGLKGL